MANWLVDLVRDPLGGSYRQAFLCHGSPLKTYAGPARFALDRLGKCCERNLWFQQRRNL